MKKNYVHLFRYCVPALLFMTGFANAQCPTISCPANITTQQEPGVCGATINWTAPVGVDSCAAATYIYTGSLQYYTVPAGVTTLQITAKGAQGGSSTSSVYAGGLGASMSGVFTVTPGTQFKILVGQFPGTASNGGGGGTFVTDLSNNPIIVAGGGGGSSDGLDSPNKHGQTTTSGASGICGGGAGGTGGNGGSIGSTFASGAGGGLLTDGQPGWVTTSGGKSFVSGGAAGTGGAIGGYGGGGSGSGYVVGAGGGGYSGGGAGSNSCGSGSVGAGGGSFNSGTSQVNASGVNSGHGVVEITSGGPPITTQVAGPPPGSVFPIGTTVVTYVVTDVNGTSSDTCSFSVTVNPQTHITSTSICTGDSIFLGGAYQTQGGSYTDTLVSSIGCDSVLKTNLFILPPPPVSLAAFTDTSVCVTHVPITLPSGAPGGGTYSGPGVSGGQFNAASAGAGTHYVVYSIVGSNGCTGRDSTIIIVEPCVGLADVGNDETWRIYPNPSSGEINIEAAGEAILQEITISSISGQVVYHEQTDPNAVRARVDLSSLPAGQYLVRVNSSKGVHTRTVTIQ